MKSQNFRFGDEKGIAVLLGLFMLFVVTIAGISLIYIAQKDKTASVDSASIRKVAFAANASFKAFESQLQLKPDTVAAILTKYAADTNYKWLLGASTASALSETKLVIGTSDLMCSARITAYDKTKQILQVQGTGFGSSNEQKSVYALYKLTGVQTATAAGTGAKYVLYLAGNGRYFNAKVDITGDIYCGSDFGFNAGADSSAVHGMIKSGVNTTLLGDFNAKGLVIDSLLYCGTGLRVNQPFTCKSKAGFEGKLIINGIVTMKNEAWFNDTNDGNANINMSSKIIHHSGKIRMVRVTSGTEDNKNAKILDIATQVGLGSTNDSAWTIDTTGLLAKSFPTSGTVTGATMNALYSACPAAKKVNGYMIAYDQWGASTDSSGVAFNGKVIWILKSGLNVNKAFFKMDTASRILIYNCGTADINGFGGNNNWKFYGLVFLTNTTGITLDWTGTNTFNGAIHLASPTTRWTCNKSATNLLMKFVYNEAILKDFETAGVLHRPSQGAATGAAGAVVLTDCKIRPQLVGVRY